MSNKILQQYIENVVSLVLKENEEEPLEEFNAIGTGAVVGYTGPLGMDTAPGHKTLWSGDKKKKKKGAKTASLKESAYEDHETKSKTLHDGTEYFASKFTLKHQIEFDSENPFHAGLLKLARSTVNLFKKDKDPIVGYVNIYSENRDDPVLVATIETNDETSKILNWEYRLFGRPLKIDLKKIPFALNLIIEHQIEISIKEFNQHLKTTQQQDEEIEIDPNVPRPDLNDPDSPQLHGTSDYFEEAHYEKAADTRLPYGETYVQSDDPNKKRSKSIAKAVSKNLNKKPGLHDPPSMGISIKK